MPCRLKYICLQYLHCQKEITVWTLGICQLCNIPCNCTFALQAYQFTCHAQCYCQTAVLLDDVKTGGKCYGVRAISKSAQLAMQQIDLRCSDFIPLCRLQQCIIYIAIPAGAVYMQSQHEMQCRLPRTYLAHHELESIVVIIVTIIRKASPHYAEGTQPHRSLACTAVLPAGSIVWFLPETAPRRIQRMFPSW